MAKQVFAVEVTESLSRTILTVAVNAEEAIAIVKKRYDDEDILLDSSDYLDAEFKILE